MGSTAEAEAPVFDLKKELTTLIAIEGDTKQVLESRNKLSINSLRPCLLDNYMTQDVHRRTLTPRPDEDKGISQ